MIVVLLVESAVVRAQRGDWGAMVVSLVSAALFLGACACYVWAGRLARGRSSSAT